MFEQGVIRPPSEAFSLLVRVTRNCPWNRCHICPAYKGKKFSRRSVEEVKKDIDMMAEEGTFDPMNDEEVVREIRLLLENLDEMPSHFRCGDFSLNLLMQVDGQLDVDKTAMIHEIDRYLALTPEQKQAYSLIQRSYPGMRSLEVVEDDTVVKQLAGKIKALEKEEDGFNKHIKRLMTFQLPQPQTDAWS